MATPEESNEKELLRGPLKKTQQGDKAIKSKNTLYFPQRQTYDQRGESNMSHFLGE